MVGLKGKKDISGVIIASSTAAVLQEDKKNQYAIAFDNFGYIDDSVKIVKVDGVYPTIATIKDESYKISRPLNVVYKESTVASGVNKAYLDFLNSAQDKQIVKWQSDSCKQSPFSYQTQTSEHFRFLRRWKSSIHQKGQITM